MSTAMNGRTEWMIAHSVSVEGTAQPRTFADQAGEENSVAAIRIARMSGHGALIIEGRVDDLFRVAREILRQVEEIDRATEDSPQLRALYGRR